MFDHHVLPTISPSICSILVFTSMIPTLYQAWQKDNFNLQLGITKSLLCMFFFGYHIHEKAIIPIIILMG